MEFFPIIPCVRVCTICSKDVGGDHGNWLLCLGVKDNDDFFL